MLIWAAVDFRYPDRAIGAMGSRLGEKSLEKSQWMGQFQQQKKAWKTHQTPLLIGENWMKNDQLPLENQQRDRFPACGDGIRIHCKCSCTCAAAKLRDAWDTMQQVSSNVYQGTPCFTMVNSWYSSTFHQPSTIIKHHQTYSNIIKHH